MIHKISNPACLSKANTSNPYLPLRSACIHSFYIQPVLNGGSRLFQLMLCKVDMQVAHTYTYKHTDTQSFREQRLS